MKSLSKRSLAEEASEQALTAVFNCLDRGESFRLEAGAGAGKTYSLVKALRYLINRDQCKLPKRRQRIACITFTNVAKDEIDARTDRNPLVYCDTIHKFCWSLISGFQKQLRTILPKLKNWTQRIDEVGGLGDRAIKYSLGYREIDDISVSIHHNDVLPLTIDMMNSEKFRRIVFEKFPIILIDEYQDTDADWIDSIKKHFLGQVSSPQFGFFGDHWQKIYGNGCGVIEHPSLHIINKNANFRSVATIVDCLNRMRPELPQFVENPNEIGNVSIFHTNNWRGARQKGGHWEGDLPSNDAHASLELVKERLSGQGWDLSSEKTKILMLTHRVLASEQGYGSLPGIFKYNEAFIKKEHGHIAFFVDHLEPACEAFVDKKYGEMFVALSSRVPSIKTHADKLKWAEAMGSLIQLRSNGTVGEVIDCLRRTRRPRLPETVEQHERELEQFDKDSGEEMPSALIELEALRKVQYVEIIALTRYHIGYSPFETKHGVKGAEFENVIVVVGRGWNLYNFNEMLDLSQNGGTVPANRHDAFERNRNLFYVVCSRPKKRLAILFTQKLSDRAMLTVERWFGADTIEALPA